jgi:hypothetical protein
MPRICAEESAAGGHTDAPFTAVLLARGPALTKSGYPGRVVFVVGDSRATFSSYYGSLRCPSFANGSFLFTP